MINEVGMFFINSPIFFFLVWVDASQSCHKANFHVGLGSTLNRSWRIKVTQYDCGLNEIAGPPGCLQYHTSNTGTIQSFNFPTGNTVGATSTEFVHCFLKIL